MFDTNELRSMTAPTILSVINACERELTRRREIERKELTDNFLEAYRALRDAGIIVDYCEEGDEEVRLSDICAFCFG